MYSLVYGVEDKSIDDAFKIGGFIATTHLDSGYYDNDVLIRDKIGKDTLDTWAVELNRGNPSANKVTAYHDRDDNIVVGVAERETAKVMELPDGEFGLYVDTIIDSTHPDYETTKNRLDIGTIDGFSIEFLPGDDAVIEEHQGYKIRHLDTDSTLYGYSIVPRPMNENAVRIKEIFNKDVKKQKTEVVPMADEKVEEKAKVVSEVKEEPKPEPEPEPAPEPTPEVVAKSISDSDMLEFNKFKEFKAKELKDKERKEIVDSIKEELKESLDNVKIQNKVMVPTDTVESKESIEFKEILLEKPELKSNGMLINKTSVGEQFKRAGRMADSLGLTKNGIKLDAEKAEFREVKNFSTNGTRMEFKLGITTNQNTDTDYLLSAAELHDVFDPVIYTALNQATVTWNLLAKDDYSMKGNNQVSFSVKTAANTTATAYLGNSVQTSNATRLKVQTKFKKYQVGVEIDGDMIAAARGGPIGDLFAEEVREATVDLLSVINQALFAEVGAETAAGIIGFEYIADSAGNTTLYNLDRTSTTLSASTFLSPAAAADTYINGSSQDITLANLRAAKRQALKEGADINTLVFVTDHIQGDKYRGIYDASQRQAPTSTRWGFEGRPEFDGIPIFEDKDCNDDDWWLVDLSTHRVAVWVPPTLEMLGKDADSVKGFIKTYFATYNRYIRRMVMIYGCATT